MTEHPLAGRSVVVTRARDQSSSLVTQLEELGASVVELPVIAIDDPVDGGASLSGAVRRLSAGDYQWVALTSPNAAARLLAGLGGRRVPGSVKWAAVGSGTARVLGDAGIDADLVPTVSRAGALAEAFPAAPGAITEDSGGTVLFPRAESVVGGLAAGLRHKGWAVDEVVVYRTVADEPDPDAVAKAARADGVAFTSPSTVTRAYELLGPRGRPAVVATIGPVTSAAVRAVGWRVSAEADPHTLEGLVAVLVDTLAGTSGAGGARSRDRHSR